MCSTKTAKVVLIVFNGLFFVVGAILIGVGAYLLSDREGFISVFAKIPNFERNEALEDVLTKSSILQAAAYAVITIGGFVLVLGLCGCCGAISLNKCLLLTYSVVTFIVLAGQMAAGIIAFKYQDIVHEYLQKQMVMTIERYEGLSLGDDDSLQMSTDPFSLAWDFAMGKFQCCGSNNYTDFEEYNKGSWQRNYTISNQTINAKVPLMCCKMKDPGLFPDNVAKIEWVDAEACLKTASKSSTNHKPCYDEVEATLVRWTNIFLAVCAVTGIIELVGMLAGCMSVTNIKENEEAVNEQEVEYWKAVQQGHRYNTVPNITPLPPI